MRGEHASLHTMHAEVAAGGLPEGVKRLCGWLVENCDLGGPAENEAAAKALNDSLGVQTVDDLYAVNGEMWGDVDLDIALEDLSRIKIAVAEVLENEKKAADEAKAAKAKAATDTLRARKAAKAHVAAEAKERAEEVAKEVAKAKGKKGKKDKKAKKKATAVDEADEADPVVPCARSPSPGSFEQQYATIHHDTLEIRSNT